MKLTKMMVRGALVMAFALLSFSTFAQDQPRLVQDSAAVAEKQDTVLIKSFAKRFNPRKALLYSAVFPGMGQVYNKKYWKLPLVYGGFVGGIIMIDFQQQRYLKLKGELFDLLNEGTTITTTVNGVTTTTARLSPSRYNETQLRNFINKSRRERDYYSIITGIWYILQMVDAHVDAHLKEFELNPQLHVKIEPMVESDQLTGRNSGVSLKLKF